MKNPKTAATIVPKIFIPQTTIVWYSENPELSVTCDKRRLLYKYQMKVFATRIKPVKEFLKMALLLFEVLVFFVLSFNNI